jgi:hypothetical protein
MARKDTTARTFKVTQVLATNVAGTERVSVPGMVVTVAELRAMVADAGLARTQMVWCDECCESIADCPVARQYVQAPAEWALANSEREEEFYAAPDGLVALYG